MPVATRARPVAGAERPARLLRTAGPPAAVVLLAALARLAYLTSSRANFNGDEAVTGIMVRGILHGDGFVFYPGQHYGGTLEVYLQALGYLLFPLPANPVTLRLAQVVLSAATTALVYLCGRRMLPTAGQALLAAAFFATGPWFNVLGGATALGFYVVGAALGTGALYCALRLGGARGDPGWALGLGLCGGLGLWNSLTSAYLLIPGLIWAAPYLLRRARVLGAAGLGFVLGAAPALGYTVVSHRLPAPVWTGTRIGLGERLTNLAGPVLREFLGVAYAHGTGGLPGWVQAVVVALAAAVYAGCLWRRRHGLLALLALRRDGRDPVDLLLVAPAAVAVCYVSSPLAIYTGTPRYLFTAYPLLALAVAALVPHRHPAASRVAYPLVLALTAALCLVFFVRSPAPGLDAREAVLRRVAAALVSRHETRVYADYSTAMALQYVAGDRLDVATCEGVARFPRTQARVAAAPRPVYVGSPLAGSGLLTEPDIIRAHLVARHVAFRTTRVGFAAIYDQLSPAVPPAGACR